MKVLLTYFKPDTGTYYSSGEYETEMVDMYQIFNEAQAIFNRREMPGLMKGHSPFITLVQVPDHPNHYPHLFLKSNP